MVDRQRLDRVTGNAVGTARCVEQPPPAIGRLPELPDPPERQRQGMERLDADVWPLRYSRDLLQVPRGVCVVLQWLPKQFVRPP
jgi:hypothetical protein